MRSWSLQMVDSYNGLLKTEINFSIKALLCAGILINCLITWWCSGKIFHNLTILEFRILRTICVITSESSFPSCVGEGLVVIDSEEFLKIANIGGSGHQWSVEPCVGIFWCETAELCSNSCHVDLTMITSPANIEIHSKLCASVNHSLNFVWVFNFLQI